MKTVELFTCNIPWGHIDFSICIIFIPMMLFFIFLMLFFFSRRRRWFGMGHNGWCRESMNADNAIYTLKNRLAKGEISEIEYDNLINKIKSI